MDLLFKLGLKLAQQLVLTLIFRLHELPQEGSTAEGALLLLHKNVIHIYGVVCVVDRAKAHGVGFAGQSGFFVNFIIQVLEELFSLLRHAFFATIEQPSDYLPILELPCSQLLVLAILAQGPNTVHFLCDFFHVASELLLLGGLDPNVLLEARTGLEEGDCDCNKHDHEADANHVSENTHEAEVGVLHCGGQFDVVGIFPEGAVG